MNDTISLLKSRTAALALLLLCGSAHPSAGAEKIASAESAKIEALISHVEKLPDATFIRNDSNYDAKSAAKFLRGKWRANEKEIKTATDFIAKVATGSSTTGKPYRIRFKDAREIACAEYLTTELKKLEAASNPKRTK
jgi:hypothetical protein